MDIEFGENRRLDRMSWMRLLGVSEEHLRTAGIAGAGAPAGANEAGAPAGANETGAPAGANETGAPAGANETGAPAEAAGKMRAALNRLLEQMDEAEPLLFDAAEPAFTYKIVETRELPIQGDSLTKHLEGCGQLVVMAVTLGHEIDRLISETQSRKIALGVVMDSGASVMAELAAEIATGLIRAETATGLIRAETATELIRTEIATGSSPATAENNAPLFMTQRFSPGYGDSPLQMQEQVLALLDADCQLGITLSKGYMMSPSKSITAIMGLADHPVTGRLATCAECVLKDKCELRKEGKICGSRQGDRVTEV